jgi:hypothetical protein
MSASALLRLAPRLLFPCAAALALSSAGAADRSGETGSTRTTIYKWVDTNGVAHYTTDLERVPRNVRGSVRALGGGEGDGFASRDAGAPAAPAPEPAAAPPPEEWDPGDAPAPPAPTPPPAGPAPGAPERWAETDKQPVFPGEEPAAETASAASGAAGGPPAAEARPALTPEEREARARELDGRIAALEAEIGSDEEALKGFLSVTAPEDPAEIAYDRSFRDVAERLPRRLAELRSLQSERAQLEPR